MNFQSHLQQRVPAGEGLFLATDVHRPGGPGPFPVILARTPYHRSSQPDLVIRIQPFLESGYAVVLQDVRGKFESDGEFEPMEHEAADGSTTLDWIANQRWCNGRIGLWGRSYPGMVQVPVAARGHPALKAIVPGMAPGNYFREWIRYDGCFALANATHWAFMHASGRCKPESHPFQWRDVWHARNLGALTHVMGKLPECLQTWIHHDQQDSFWEKINQWNLHEKVSVPAFHSAAWFDHISGNQYRAFQTIRSNKRISPDVRKSQRLMVGPWGHLTLDGEGKVQRSYGQWNFGASAERNVFREELRFLDHHVREMDNGVDDEAPVRLFLMGANRWMNLSEWPVPDAVEMAWFLGAGTSDDVPGKLSLSPSSGSSEVTKTHDPFHPVPTLGGQSFWGIAEDHPLAIGPVDQRCLLGRSDVHYFRSEPLPRAMTVIGHPSMSVTLSSDAEDTDVVAKLCVENSDGIFCLSLAQIRCRYREDFSRPIPLSHHSPVYLNLEFFPMAYEFPAGSRIGLVIAHSDFPRINSHPGSMDPPLFPGIPRLARNTLHLGGNGGAALRLPIVSLN